MNISSNNFTVYFRGDITVKLSSWFWGWIESMFYVYLPFILRQFVTMDEYTYLLLSVYTWVRNSYRLYIIIFLNSEITIVYRNNTYVILCILNNSACTAISSCNYYINFAYSIENIISRTNGNKWGCLQKSQLRM